MSKIMSSSATAPAVLGHGGLVGIELLAANHIDGDRDGGATRGHLGDQGLGGWDQVGFAQRLADVLAGGGEEGIGDTAADHQLLAFFGQRFQYGQLGGDLGAADDGDHRPRRVGQRLVQRFQLFRNQLTGAGGRGKLSDTVGGGFSAVGCAKGIHDEDVAQRGVFRAVSSTFFFSPLLTRQFSSSTTSPSATSKPPSTQSLIRRTGLPSLAAITSATGLQGHFFASIRLRSDDPGGK
jgi:hypothetical protein